MIIQIVSGQDNPNGDIPNIPVIEMQVVEDQLDNDAPAEHSMVVVDHEADPNDVDMSLDEVEAINDSSHGDSSVQFIGININNQQGLNNNIQSQGMGIGDNGRATVGPTTRIITLSVSDWLESNDIDTEFWGNDTTRD